MIRYAHSHIAQLSRFLHRSTGNPMTPTRGQVIFAMISGIVGFLAGSVGLLLQLAPHLRSAEIVSLPPEQVLFVLHQNPGSDVEMVRLAAVQRHINTRTVGKAAILVRETATLELAGEQYEYNWQSFEHFQPQDTKLVSTDTSGALPRVLGPGEVESHETYFAPQVNSLRFERWQDFLTRARRSPEVAVRFTAYFYDGSSTSTTCIVDLTEKRLERLENRRWDAPICREDATSGQSAS